MSFKKVAQPHTICGRARYRKPPEQPRDKLGVSKWLPQRWAHGETDCFSTARRIPGLLLRQTRAVWPDIVAVKLGREELLRARLGGRKRCDFLTIMGLQLEYRPVHTVWSGKLSAISGFSTFFFSSKQLRQMDNCQNVYISEAIVARGVRKPCPREYKPVRFAKLTTILHRMQVHSPNDN